MTDILITAGHMTKPEWEALLDEAVSKLMGRSPAEIMRMALQPDPPAPSET